MIFRVGTQVLIVLWFIGIALSVVRFHDLTVPLVGCKELCPEVAQLEEDKDEPSGTSARDAALPLLVGGERIQVRWPSHAGFVPRSLSCNMAGSQLVISDDFALYVGDLEFAGTDPPWRPGTRPAATIHSSVAFKRMPPCSVLDGQELQDIGVGCHGAGLSSECYVFVLHAQGRRISECQLPAPVRRLTMVSGNGLATIDSSAQSASTDQEKEKSRTMAVSTGWLAQQGKGETDQVDAVAINSKLRSRIIVGTTLGQIVQLQTATSDSKLLVPQHAMRQQRVRPVKPGSIHILPSGAVIMLHHADHSVQAFEPQLGHLMGEWRLPRGVVKWLTLCGGGTNLFVLGLRNGTIPELYRFLVPAKLKLEVTQVAPGPLSFPATKVVP